MAANFSKRKVRLAGQPWLPFRPFPASLYTSPLSRSILVSPCPISISAGTQPLSTSRDARPLCLLWLNFVPRLEVYLVASSRLSSYCITFMCALISR